MCILGSLLRSAPLFILKPKECLSHLIQFEILLILGDCYTHYIRRKQNKLHLHISNPEIKVTYLNKD